MKDKSYKESILSFFKKYGYIVILSVVMIILSVLLIVSVANPHEESKEPVNTTPVTFYNPVLNFTIAKGYDDKNLVYNSTLKQWEAHKALALTAAENSEVYAVLDGEVLDVYSNYLNGTVVVLKHDGDLKTYYSSLQEDVKVKKGDKVSKGQVIGKVGTTANAELDLGNHLTFQVTEKDVKVDPSTYLNLTEK